MMCYKLVCVCVCVGGGGVSSDWTEISCYVNVSRTEPVRKSKTACVTFNMCIVAYVLLTYKQHFAPTL